MKNVIKQSPLTLINGALKKAGLEQRLVRGRGYYYVTGVSCSSSLYAMWLEKTAHDLHYAREHVNEVLAEEGIHKHVTRELKCVEHPIGYTGYLRRREATQKTLAQWQASIVRDVRIKRPGK